MWNDQHLFHNPIILILENMQTSTPKTVTSKVNEIPAVDPGSTVNANTKPYNPYKPNKEPQLDRGSDVIVTKKGESTTDRSR